jgi:heterodisulfide reductase subunit C2
MTQEVMNIKEKSFKLSNAVEAVGGIDVSYCYQCGKCSTGCPVAYEMDLTPTQLMHAIQLGLKDLVYKSKTMWLCASCLTCSTRCPQDVDIAEALDSVKIMMQRDGKRPKMPGVLKLFRSMTWNMKFFGRMHDLSMAAVYKLLALNISKEDMIMFFKMLRNGKFKIFPKFKSSFAVRRIFRQAKKQERA